PNLSSGASLLARLFARIVPPMPPPTITIFIRASSFGLADGDVPHTGLFAGAEELVSDLFHPFGYVARRPFVGRQHLELVADVGELDPADQLHQRTWAETAAGVDDLMFRHREILALDQGIRGWTVRPRFRTSRASLPGRRRESG